MERIERLVRTWVASGREDEVRETVAGTQRFCSSNAAYSYVSAITSGDASVLDVVKALGEYLTSEDDQLRVKGTSFHVPISRRLSFLSITIGVEFLSRVIDLSPQEKLNRNPGSS